MGYQNITMDAKIQIKYITSTVALYKKNLLECHAFMKINEKFNDFLFKQR
jgi:hypothetical protein